MRLIREGMSLIVPLTEVKGGVVLINAFLVARFVNRVLSIMRGNNSGRL